MSPEGLDDVRAKKTRASRDRDPLPLPELSAAIRPIVHYDSPLAVSFALETFRGMSVYGPPPIRKPLIEKPITLSHRFETCSSQVRINHYLNQIFEHGSGLPA